MVEDDDRRSRYDFAPPPRFIPPKTLAETKIFLVTRVEELIKYCELNPKRDIAKKTLDLNQKLLKQIEEFGKYHAESTDVALRAHS